jgi:hypothetical protein
MLWLMAALMLHLMESSILGLPTSASPAYQQAEQAREQLLPGTRRPPKRLGYSYYSFNAPAYVRRSTVAGVFCEVQEPYLLENQVRQRKPVISF